MSARTSSWAADARPRARSKPPSRSSASLAAAKSPASASCSHSAGFASAISPVTGLSGSLDWFFDPIAGTSQPRAGVDATSKIEIGRDWQITPNASFYTLLRQSRSDLGGGRTPGADNTGTVELVALDATQLRGEIPCSYRLTNQAFLNFGLRGSLRGRSMLDDDFSLTELVEFWAFAGLTLRFASGRDTGSWLSM